MPVAGIPLLRRVIETARLSHYIDDIIVATTDLVEDDPIEAYSSYLGYKCCRGDSLNVLSRFVGAAEHLKDEDTIVRVTADNPFNWKSMSEKLFDIHISRQKDYTCVDGLSHVVYEFVAVSALRKTVLQQDLSIYDREHVTPYLRNNPHKFDVEIVSADVVGVNADLDKLLTIDTEQDRVFVEKLITDLSLDKQMPDFKEIYKWLLTSTSNMNYK